MKAYTRSGSIAPLILNHGHYVEVSGKPYAPTTYPQPKNCIAGYIEGWFGPESVWTFSRRHESRSPARIPK
jgi:hypothetical protein